MNPISRRRESSGRNTFRFFFSSRRRHTKSKRDWSSDVCSSDLAVLGALARALPGRIPAAPAGAISPVRSEERRVGKECRSGVARILEKNRFFEARENDLGEEFAMGAAEELGFHLVYGVGAAHED